MGGQSSSELAEENKKLKKRISSLEQEIEKIHKQLEELRAELSSDRVLYDKVRNYVATWQIARPSGIVFKEVAAIIGPKGSGKSTYLWMKIPGFPKPVKCSGNGTNKIHILQEHGFMDTIGINIEIKTLMRLLALFLVHEAVPMNAIFCQNDRIERTLALLTHLGITKYYVLAMDAKYIHRYYNSIMSFAFNLDTNSAFDEDAYKAWYSRNKNCYRCDAQTRIPIRPLLNTFEDTFKLLFPLGRVDMVPYETFVSNRKEDESKKAARVFAYMVCKELKAFYDEHGGNEVAFMDEL